MLYPLCIDAKEFLEFKREKHHALRSIMSHGVWTTRLPRHSWFPRGSCLRPTQTTERYSLHRSFYVHTFCGLICKLVSRRVAACGAKSCGKVGISPTFRDDAATDAEA